MRLHFSETQATAAECSGFAEAFCCFLLSEFRIDLTIGFKDSEFTKIKSKSLNCGRSGLSRIFRSRSAPLSRILDKWELAAR
jgi:hypothetical protein